MPIPVICPNCSIRTLVPDDVAGKTGKCPGCKNPLPIPAVAPKPLAKSPIFDAIAAFRAQFLPSDSVDIRNKKLERLVLGLIVTMGVLGLTVVALLCFVLWPSKTTHEIQFRIPQWEAAQPAPAPQEPRVAWKAPPPQPLTDHPIERDGVRVAIASVRVERPTRISFFGSRTISDTSHLVVQYEVTNITKDRRLFFNHGEPQRIEDNVGNKYRVFDGWIVGSTATAILEPGQSASSACAFERPLKQAETVDFELPANIVAKNPDEKVTGGPPYRFRIALGTVEGF